MSRDSCRGTVAHTKQKALFRNGSTPIDPSRNSASPRTSPVFPRTFPRESPRGVFPGGSPVRKAAVPFRRPVSAVRSASFRVLHSPVYGGGRPSVRLLISPT